MVKVIDVKTFEKEGEKGFTMLVVQGGVEPIISKQTGKIYLTMRKANVPTTFDIAIGKSLIGTELPGTVKKIECEAYEYTIPESGEIVSLSYQWQYVDEDLVNATKQIINHSEVL